MPLRTGCAGVAFLALGALRAGVTLVAFLALNALLALRTLRASFTLRTCWTLNALYALWALRALQLADGVPHQIGFAPNVDILICTDLKRTVRTVGERSFERCLSGVNVFNLERTSVIALVALRTLNTLRTLYALRTLWAAHIYG